MISIVRVEKVPVDQLTKHPRNPRRGDLEAIKESLATHGQFKPIVANLRTGHILAGNHTYEAAVQLGWDEIEVAWVDVDEFDELRIMLADNRTADKAEYDDDSLDDILKDLIRVSDDMLVGTGFDIEDVDLGKLADEIDAKPLDPDARSGKVKIVLLVDPEEELFLRDELVTLAGKIRTLEVR